MSSNSEHIVVSTTIDNSEAAGRLAEALVEKRLAACVQSMPVHSVYRWDGKIESSDEILLLAKTVRACEEKIVAFIKESHSYEVPEIIVTPITGGFGGYLDWIKAETDIEQ